MACFGLSPGLMPPWGHCRFTDIGTSREGHFGQLHFWQLIGFDGGRHEGTLLGEQPAGKIRVALGAGALIRARRGLGAALPGHGQLPALGFDGVFFFEGKAPERFMMTHCWAIDSTLFHAQ